MSPLSLLIPLVLWLVVALLLAPVEAMRWWAGWLPAAGEPDPAEPHTRLRPRSAPPASVYIVFLDGISKGTMRSLQMVDDFLAGLQQALPEACIVSDLLPYSVFNVTLMDERRPLGRFWRVIEGFKIRRNPIGFLINIRNMFQAAVSADWRYGMAYNVAMTRVIALRLVRHGYDINNPAPLVLIGYSGGAQVAAGTASMLRSSLGAPVHVVSIAGVMAGNAPYDAIDSWHQIVSNRDPVEKLGYVLFPLRWRTAHFSPWNRAKRAGKVHIVRLDGARHDAAQSYMDKDAEAPEGGSLLDRTVKTVAGIVEEFVPPLGVSASPVGEGSPSTPSLA